MKWLWLLFWDPIKALDLRDNRDQVDFGKISPFLFMWFVVLLKVLGAYTEIKVDFSISELVFLGSLSCGIAGLRIFLKSRAVTAHTETRQEHKITEEIKRVVDEDGVRIQPTP